jgi:hypothetical protein
MKQIYRTRKIFIAMNYHFDFCGFVFFYPVETGRLAALGRAALGSLPNAALPSSRLTHHLSNIIFMIAGSTYHRNARLCGDVYYPPSDANLRLAKL